MSYSKRIPPIKLKLNVEEFNKLLQILSNMSDYREESIAKKSVKLKDNFLKYSVPFNDDNEQTFIDIRCYQNEIVDLFYIMFYGIKDCMKVETNYYEVLIKVRDNLKQEKMIDE